MIRTNFEADVVNNKNPFDLIPNETIEYHIFTNIPFNNWIVVLSLVCKRWMQISAKATVSPRQISFEQENGFIVRTAVFGVARYRPTILYFGIPVELRNIMLIVTAANCIDTLILRKIILRNQYHSMEQITTLCLSACEGVAASDIFKLFPNLKRLQVNYININDERLNQLDELALIDVDRKDLIEISDAITIPKITIVYSKVRMVVQRINGVTKVYNGDEISYEDYLRYFGETKLSRTLREKEFEVAAQLLDSQTIEYDAFLQEYYKRVHIFPGKIHFNSLVCDYHKALFYCGGDEPYLNAWKLLARTNKISVPHVWLRMIGLVHEKCFDEALNEFKNWSGYTDPKECESDEMRTAFFALTTAPYITVDHLKQPGVNERARAIMNKTYDIASYIETTDQFKKIVFLRDDWSDVVTETCRRNEELFWAMVDQGCKIPLSYTVAGDFSLKVIDKLIERKLFTPDEIAFKCTQALLKKVVRKYRIDMTIEKKNTSLFNYWINRGGHTEDFILEYKHLLNHFDSSGNSPLLLLLTVQYPRMDLIKTLLNYGADPTKHDPRSLSPLATVITSEWLHIDQKLTIIQWLVDHGGSVNAPCMYQGRMCSPLMIAILNDSYRPLHDLLISHGALAFYQD